MTLRIWSRMRRGARAITRWGLDFVAALSAPARQIRVLPVPWEMFPSLWRPHKWYLFEAFCPMRMRKSYRAQSYRLAERPPRFESLRGSLYNEGSVYQSASRVSALVFVLVSVWLAPAASYENRATMADGIFRAIEAREELLATGSGENWPGVQPESSGQPWSFNTALDSLVGTLLFGTAVDKPGSRDMMS